ncbi:hypothetical protein RBB50_007667 [Rhinocladiella similis]
MASTQHDCKYEVVSPQDTTTESSGDPEGHKAPPEKRFWVRSISCVLFPPIFTAYFIWTYIEFLRPESLRRSSTSPTYNGTYIWWSWFVIGALGLNVSTYVLAGVEAGMLMTRRSGALTTHQVDMHKDKSWSKISDWIKVLRAVLTKTNGKDKVFSWIWLPLFTLSFLSWAFVLTGLTMGTQDSFQPGKTPGVQVLGPNVTNFNRRAGFDVLDAAYQNWGQTQEAKIPWLSALYFTPDFANNFNMTTGNTLPSSTEHPILLAPQAEQPVTGEAWGILLKYQCTPITELSDFKLLNHRINSSNPGYIYGVERKEDADPFSLDVDVPPHIYYYNPTANGTISLLSPQADTESSNIQMFAEVALPGSVPGLSDYTRDYSTNATYSIDDEIVLEMALWQYIPVDGVQDGEPAWQQGTIPGLKGEHVFRWPSMNQTTPVPDVPLHAIGVQCTSSSETGRARLDGISGTFHGFRRENAYLDGNDVSFIGLPRFSLAVPAMFLPGIRGDSAFGIGTGSFGMYPKLNEPWLPDPNPYDYVQLTDSVYWMQNRTSPDWMTPLIQSAGLPRNMTGQDDSGYIQYDRPITPSELQHAMEEAHKLVAVSLMYDQHLAPAKAWAHPDLVATEPWTQLVAADNSVPPLLVLVMLVMWAVGCMVLGFMYGFKKRWDAYFSVRSMYWYCIIIAKLDPAEVMRS